MDETLFQPCATRKGGNEQRRITQEQQCNLACKSCYQRAGLVTDRKWLGGVLDNFRSSFALARPLARTQAFRVARAIIRKPVGAGRQ